MKILYVLEYYYPHVGGVEILFQKIIESAAKKGHQVRVVTIKLPGTLSRENYNGVEIIRLRMPGIGMRYWFTFLAFFRLIWDVSSFDIIHTTTYNAALPAWLAAKIFRKKTIITIHEVWGRLWMQIPDMSFFSQILHRFYESLVINIPYNLITTVSDFTEKRLNKSNIQTVHNGVDNNLFSRIGNEGKSLKIKKDLCLDEAYVAMYFGRPGWAKGLEYFVQAIPAIKNEIPNFKAVLLLSRDPIKKYNKIIEQIKQLQIQDDVLVLDPVPRVDVPSYLMVADCIVIPSVSEGFGFSAAESSALDVPIVATKAGSLPEVVSGKVCFCEARDSHSLTEAVIRSYHKDYQLIPKKKFLWSDMVNKYIDIYKQLNQKQ